MDDVQINIHCEENLEAQQSMKRWRATFDDNFVTWAYGSTPLAAAINLLGKYRWNAEEEVADLKG